MSDDPDDTSDFSPDALRRQRIERQRKLYAMYAEYLAAHPEVVVTPENDDAVREAAHAWNLRRALKRAFEEERQSTKQEIVEALHAEPSLFAEVWPTDYRDALLGEVTWLVKHRGYETAGQAAVAKVFVAWCKEQDIPCPTWKWLAHVIGPLYQKCGGKAGPTGKAGPRRR
jgi:hypothetical protein